MSRPTGSPISLRRPGLRIDQARLIECVGVEHAGGWPDSGREIDEPALQRQEGSGQPKAEGEVGRPAGLDRRLDGAGQFPHGIEDEFGLFASLLLEGGDDLSEGIVFLGVESLVPPHHEIGGPGARRRQEQRGDDGCDQSLHERHSARICLIRAIASSTACSGLMTSATMR